MHFIYPKNYNFSPKLFGFIEYSTAIIDAIIAVVLYVLVNTFFNDINIKIFIFISCFFPILLISIIGLNKESFITVFRYLTKFITSQKVYLYKKQKRV